MNRRKFIQGCSFAVGVLALSPASVCSAEDKRTAEEPASRALKAQAAGKPKVYFSRGKGCTLMRNSSFGMRNDS